MIPRVSIFAGVQSAGCHIQPLVQRQAQMLYLAWSASVLTVEFNVRYQDCAFLCLSSLQQKRSIVALQKA